MLSPFGIAIRKIRLDRQLLLKDMADTLGVSSAFLSSVESGKRRVPKGWIESISRIYHLSKEDVENLEIASSKSAPDIKIPISAVSSEKRDLAFSFAKALDGLSDQDVERIMNAINAPKRGEK